MHAAGPTPPSPLARALAAQAEAQFDDLNRARGVDASTFAALARRAGELLETLESWGYSEQTREPLAAHRAALHAVAVLLEDPGARAIPPSNDRIFAAVLDVTELTPIVRTLGGNPAGRDAIRRHLDETDPARARADRLALSFAGVCKRGGLDITPPGTPGDPVGIRLDRWRLSAVPAIPLAASDVLDAVRAAHDTLRALKRPGLILLEAGPSLPFKPATVADDRVAIALMNERLEAFMLEQRAPILDAIGDDHAFGLVVHATLPATNAVSKRLLFAECFRAVNLCDADDPRAEGFREIAEAMQNAT